MCHLLAVAASALLMIGHTGYGQDTNPRHAYDHGHVEAQDDVICKEHFDDAQVADRPLTDWDGEWRSVYPLLVAGALDPVIAHQAETGGRTVAEYRAYHDTGYQTDTDRIVIDGDTVTFHSGDRSIGTTNASDGRDILTCPKGNRGVWFIFGKTAGDADAPQFIQATDHCIAPLKLTH